jgi:hypothetical protein
MKPYTAEEIVDGGWLPKGSILPERRRLLVFYVQTLLDLGMDYRDLGCMLGDIYWSLEACVERESRGRRE